MSEQTTSEMYWSTAEAAEHYDVSVSTVRKMCAAGALTCFRFGNTWHITPPQAPVFPPPPWLSVAQAAYLLGVSETTVKEWSKSGRLPGAWRDTSHRGWKIPRPALEHAPTPRGRRARQPA
jgi:excisionase family DNA binding protein